MAGTILFVINGLGLGNSTRCLAIIEQLNRRGHRVHVMTSGNGLVFFQQCPLIESVQEIPPYYYSQHNGRINAWKTVRSAPHLYRLSRDKRALLEKHLDLVKPDLVIMDSEYSVGPVRRRKIPLIAINNADVVTTEYRNHGGPGKSAYRDHYWFVEYPDYLFHRWNFDAVISSSAERTPLQHSRIRRVGLIVRESIRKLCPKQQGNGWIDPSRVKSVVFMLSGSSFASRIETEMADLPFHVDVIGRTGPNSKHVTYHGKLMDNIHFLEKADVLVINGGFSAVSEALALDKPTLVIPLPGHAEQTMNAHVARRLGRALVTTAEEALPLLLRSHASNRWEDLAPHRKIAGCDGAIEAADIIETFLIPCTMVHRGFSGNTIAGDHLGHDLVRR